MSDYSTFSDSALSHTGSSPSQLLIGLTGKILTMTVVFLPGPRIGYDHHGAVNAANNTDIAANTAITANNITTSNPANTVNAASTSNTANAASTANTANIENRA